VPGNPSSNESIKSSTLRRMPQLKACPYWDRAVFLGRLVYKSQVASYDGGIVKYEGRLYYVNRSQIEALQAFVRWDQRKRISVIEDD